MILLTGVQSCLETEKPLPENTKGRTTIKGKAVLVNSDVPVSGLNVFIWRRSDGVGMRRELVDETLTDSAGNFELSFEVDKFITLEVNYDNLPFLGYHFKNNQKGEYYLDGNVHEIVAEVIPPGWVNVRLFNKNRMEGWDFIGVGSSFGVGSSIKYGFSPDTTIMLKVRGNMVDSVSFSYANDTNYSPYFKIIKTIKYPIHVPAFQTKDLLIEY